MNGMPSGITGKSEFVLQLKPTNRCSMSCPHCYNPRDADALANELTTRQWVKIVRSFNRFAERRGLRPRVHFIGGEPLLRPDLFDIVTAALENDDCVATVVTNGVEVNEHIIGMIKEKFHAVTVNLPCATPLEFLDIRGSPSFELVVSNVRSMVKSGINVALAVNIMKQNAENVGAVIPLAAELGACRVSYHRFVGMKRLDDWHPTADQLKAAVRGITDQTKRYGQVKVVSRDPVLSMMLGLPVKPCIVGHSILNIEPDGKATPCRYIHMEIGDAARQSVRDIVESESFRELGDAAAIRGACLNCRNRNECVGCRALAFHHGDIMGEDPLCSHDGGGPPA